MPQRQPCFPRLKFFARGGEDAKVGPGTRTSVSTRDSPHHYYAPSVYGTLRYSRELQRGRLRVEGVGLRLEGARSEDEVLRYDGEHHQL